MEQLEQSLSDFAKELSNYITLGDGESYTGIYKGYRIIEKEMQGETKKYARYLFEDLVDGKIRNLDSRSGKLAVMMEKVRKGQEITISRKGEGFETKYKVETAEGEITEPIDLGEDDIPIIEDSE